MALKYLEFQLTFDVFVHFPIHSFIHSLIHSSSLTMMLSIIYVPDISLRTLNSKGIPRKRIHLEYIILKEHAEEP